MDEVSRNVPGTCSRDRLSDDLLHFCGPVCNPQPVKQDTEAISLLLDLFIQSSADAAIDER